MALTRDVLSVRSALRGVRAVVIGACAYIGVHLVMLLVVACGPSYLADPHSAYGEELLSYVWAVAVVPKSLCAGLAAWAAYGSPARRSRTAGTSALASVVWRGSLVMAGIAVLVWGVTVGWCAREAGRAQTTEHHLYLLATSVHYYVTVTGRYPDVETPGGVESMRAELLHMGMRSDDGGEGLKPRATDGWGQPWVLDQSPTGLGFTVRSVGLNGLNEGGAGDDISYTGYK